MTALSLSRQFCKFAHTSPSLMPLACPEEDVVVMLAGWQTEDEAREG